MSPLSQGRGLKLYGECTAACKIVSPLSQGRGLKHQEG